MVASVAGGAGMSGEARCGVEGRRERVLRGRRSWQGVWVGGAAAATPVEFGCWRRRVGRARVHLLCATCSAWRHVRLPLPLHGRARSPCPFTRVVEDQSFTWTRGIYSLCSHKWRNEIIHDKEKCVRFSRALVSVREREAKSACQPVRWVI